MVLCHLAAQVYNKIDQISMEEVNRLAREPDSIVIRWAMADLNRTLSLSGGLEGGSSFLGEFFVEIPAERMPGIISFWKFGVQ